MAIRTIDVLGNSIRKEADANAAVRPGELLLRDASGEVGPGGTADGTVLVAHENDLHGSDIDTAYVSGNRVQIIAPPKGGEVLLIASGTITAGDMVERDTAGEVATFSAGVIVGQAMESATVGLHVRVEIA